MLKGLKLEHMSAMKNIKVWCCYCTFTLLSLSKYESNPEESIFKVIRMYWISNDCKRLNVVQPTRQLYSMKDLL